MPARAEMTIDQLAAAVGMTVRNVRAYASRGLIPPPRLVGRTGWYGEEHVNRLNLIRGLVERGYTLAAVEKALLSHSAVPAGLALELLRTLDHPLGEEERPEETDVDTLARLAGVEEAERFIDRLVEFGLVERLEGRRIRLQRPATIRAGAEAVRLGLDPDAVVGMLPALSTHLNAVAQLFVDEFRRQVWQPFAEAGLPDEQWPQVLGQIEAILPVAGQAVIAVFRTELGRVIESALGEELGALADSTTDSA